MLSIRLKRMGRRHDPFYRIVVADSRRARNGRFIEILGHYDPVKNPVEINIDSEKVDKWLEKGAKPSDTVANLLKQVKKA